MMDAGEVLRFWFEQAKPSQWWQRDAAFDQTVRTRFGDIHRAASRAELWMWRDTADGRLAEIVVLDQFSRNIYRDDARAFANDALALCLAQEAVRCSADLALVDARRAFVYMPYMHSESLSIHATAVELFRERALANLDYELRHKAIIDRFGRYPHRNHVLGRESSAEERAFLEQPGSSF
jgi:uncharacterized protein (DUF924 family)